MNSSDALPRHVFNVNDTSDTSSIDEANDGKRAQRRRNKYVSHIISVQDTSDTSSIDDVKNVRKRQRMRKKSIRDIFSFNDKPDPTKCRIVAKNGDSTIKIIKQPDDHGCCYTNLYISFVELSSFMIGIIFVTCFLLSWCVFAMLYYIVSQAYGDFKVSDEDVSASLCIVDGTSFQAILMFSMETQTTIGYGSRYVTEKCPGSIILVILQSIFGVMLLSVLTGVVLFKFQEPRKRAQTILFSKVACVNEEDGKHYIEIQILNMQKSQLVGPAVSGICIMNRTDGPGKFRFDMDFDPIHMNSRLFFRPRVYRHLVEYSSPFWHFDRQDFETRVYEIIVILEGVDEYSDNFVQVRTSYLPVELKWGRHFKAMCATRSGETFKLNYNDFTKTNILEDMADDSASTTFRKSSAASMSDSALGDDEYLARNGSVVVQMESYDNPGFQHEADDTSRRTNAVVPNGGVGSCNVNDEAL